jgi:hypothetical protein
VDDEWPAVDGAPLEVEQLVESRDPALGARRGRRRISAATRASGSAR